MFSGAALKSPRHLLSARYWAPDEVIFSSGFLNHATPPDEEIPSGTFRVSQPSLAERRGRCGERGDGGRLPRFGVFLKNVLIKNRRRGV